MSRRAWVWGAVLLAVGGIVAGTALYRMLSFHASGGSQQAVTLGQVASLILGGILLFAAASVLGTGVRRHLAVRRRRRLRERLERST